MRSLWGEPDKLGYFSYDIKRISPFHFGLSVDMTDTMATKLLMSLLPIIESSASEGGIAIFAEYIKVMLHCKLAVEAIDLS